MLIEGEITVIQYFERYGLKSLKIKESNIKTPDFGVYRNNELLFYCEEKTIEYDDFIGDEGINDTCDKSSSKLATRINTAIKQFESVNPEHFYPNVLAFNNKDTLINPNDLFIAITKYGIDENEKTLKILDSLGRIEERLAVIDLFLWFENGKFVNWIWADIFEEHTSKLKLILK